MRLDCQQLKIKQVVNQIINKPKVMIHDIIIGVIHLFWLMVVIPLYMLYNKNYLDIKQAQLLIIQAFILISFMFPGWVVHAARLVGNGFFVLIVLDLCIIEYEQFIDRYQIKQNGGKSRQSKKYNFVNGGKVFMIQHYKTLKKFKFKQTFIWPIFIFLWILIKIIFTNAPQFGKGLILNDGSVFNGFLTTMDGWNCNYAQLSTIPIIWFSVLAFCCWFVYRILQSSKSDREVNEQNYNDINSYKIYLLYYLLCPSLMVELVESTYNTIAHFLCDGILECYPYFKYGIVLYAIMCLGIPLVITVFFFKKNGRFSIQEQVGGRNSQISSEILD